MTDFVDKDNPPLILAKLLTKLDLKLKIAESFTGGYLTSLLTAIQGASVYLKESIIAYSPQSKIERLKVDRQIINKYGTVSENCCRAMLNGIKDSCDIAIATTGNAGPASEKDGEEGLCFMGAAYKNKMVILKKRFIGLRQENIFQGAMTAINLAIELLEKQGVITHG